MEQFSFISEKGATSLPSKKEIDQLRENDQEHYLLVLDSSICLDIINLVNNKRSARVDKNKIFNLLEYIQNSKVEKSPTFGLIELCYDRNSLEINEEKFREFKNKLDFAFNYKCKLFRRLLYDYNTEYYIYRTPQLKNTSVKSFIDQLNLFYVGLLKIREIATIHSLSKQNSEKNIIKYIDWMTNDLNFMLGPEYALAIQIFGGNSDYRSMIKLDSSKEKVLKALLGSAWDLFHSRAGRNKSQLSKMIGKSVSPIFVTNDRRLNDLLSPIVILQTELNSTKISLTNKNQALPHFSTSFITYLNKEMMRRTKERFFNKNIPDKTRIQTMIWELEKKLP